ncbi:MAG: M28 family peptidase [Acidobacteriota bacterium]
MNFTRHKTRASLGALLGVALLALMFCANFCQAVIGAPSAIITAQDTERKPAGRTTAAAVGAAEHITAEQLKDYLDFIASDELEGRDTPSRGLDIAAKFIALHLSRWGLKPAGDQTTGNQKSYFQRIPLRRDRIDPAQTSLELNGQRFSFGDDLLALPTGFSGTTGGPLVYVGDGWMIKAKNINAYQGIDVKGKILIANNAGLPPGIGEADLTGVAGESWDYPSSYARRHGAAGIILIPSPNARANWERQRQAGLEQSHLAALSLEEPGGPELALSWPRVAIITASAALTDALLGGEGRDPAEFFGRNAQGKLPPSFTLDPNKKLSITIGLKSEAAATQNVVAMVEGSDPALKHEYVTIGAHYDGAVGSPVQPDAIYNAADDNASGTVALLAMAEALMRGPRPKRSILFIWDAGEERGLLGSYHFTAKPLVPLDKIVAHFNIDMIGRTRTGEATPANEGLAGPDEVFVVGPRSLSTELSEMVDGVNRSYLKLKLNYRFDNVNNQFFFPRSDHVPYLQQGIPILSWFTGLHEDYHRPSDSSDKIDYQKMEKITRTLFVTAWSLADAAKRPRIDQPLPPGLGRK